MGKKVKKQKSNSLLKLLIAVFVVLAITAMGSYYYSKEVLQEIRLPEYSIELELGEQYQLDPIFVPETVKDIKLFYSGYTLNVISVTPEGLITATDNGNGGEDRETEVTMISDNNKEATLKVTVKDSYAVSSGKDLVKYTENMNVNSLVFKNKVEKCVGFSFSFMINEVIKGKDEYFKDKEFIVYGRCDEGEWIRLGDFVYGEIGSVTNLDLTFIPTDLSEVICILGPDELSSPKEMSWRDSMNIGKVRRLK